MDSVPTTPVMQKPTELQPSTTKKTSDAGLSEENRLDEIIKSVLGDTQVAPTYGSKEEVVHVKDLPKFKEFSFGEDGNKLQVRKINILWRECSRFYFFSVIAVRKTMERYKMEAVGCWNWR